MSPMASEFIAASEAAKDTKYFLSTIEQVLSAINFNKSENFFQKSILFCNNTTAIQFIKNPVESIKNQYIDL